MKSLVLPAAILQMASLFLAGCQSQPASPPSPPVLTDQPTLAAPAGEIEIATEPVDAIVINEDPPRSATFNINTLSYELPGMEEVEVLNITYAHHGDLPLTMDVYYPPGTPTDARLPVVIFGIGYKMSFQPLRNAHFYTSWGRLVASAGMVGIAYDTEQPDQDLEILVEFIRQHADKLRIDPDRIGIWSSSANPPTVMSYLMQEKREGIRFSVYFYGSSITPDGRYAEEMAKVCRGRGCLVSELTGGNYIDPDLPLFVVKVGRDFVIKANEAMDYFIDFMRGEGVEITVVEYEEGRHGFDTEQETDEAAAIIAQTIEFMQEQLGID